MYTVAKRCRRRTVAAFWVGAASLLSAWPSPAPAQVQTTTANVDAEPGEEYQ